MALTTTVILPVLECLFTMSLVLVIFKANLVALIGQVTVTIESSLRACLIFNACLTDSRATGPIIRVTVNITI